MIRRLTSAEEARLLTAEAVAQLPEGAELFIKWWGGYGPYRYRVVQHLPGYGTQVADVDPAMQRILPLTLRWQEIGAARYQNRCFLPAERSAACSGP